MISIKNKESLIRNFVVSVDKDGRQLLNQFLSYIPKSKVTLGPNPIAETLELEFPEIFELIDRLRT